MRREEGKFALLDYQSSKMVGIINDHEYFNGCVIGFKQDFTVS